MGLDIKKKFKKLAKGAALVGTAIGLSKLGKKKPTKIKPKYFGGNKTGDASIASNIAKFDRDISNMAKINTEGRSGTQGGDEQIDVFKKGGLVKKGKPKLAKRGWK